MSVGTASSSVTLRNALHIPWQTVLDVQGNRANFVCMTLHMHSRAPAGVLHMHWDFLENLNSAHKGNWKTGSVLVTVGPAMLMILK